LWFSIGKKTCNSYYKKGEHLGRERAFFWKRKGRRERGSSGEEVPSVSSKGGLPEKGKCPARQEREKGDPLENWRGEGSSSKRR